MSSQPDKHFTQEERELIAQRVHKIVETLNEALKDAYAARLGVGLVPGPDGKLEAVITQRLMKIEGKQEAASPEQSDPFFPRP